MQTAIASQISRELGRDEMTKRKEQETARRESLQSCRLRVEICAGVSESKRRDSKELSGSSSSSVEAERIDRIVHVAVAEFI